MDVISFEKISSIPLTNETFAFHTLQIPKYIKGNVR